MCDGLQHNWRRLPERQVGADRDSELLIECLRACTIASGVGSGPANPNQLKFFGASTIASGTPSSRPPARRRWRRAGWLRRGVCEYHWRTKAMRRACTSSGDSDASRRLAPRLDGLESDKKPLAAVS
jgi:hypothetical protein